MITETLIKCERAYIQLFSTDYEDDNRIRFRNKNIKDMYSHNLCFIKKQEKELKLRGLFEEEIALSKSERSEYTNIRVNGNVNSAILSYIKYPSKLSVYGFYQLDVSKVSKLKIKPNLEIRKIVEVDAFEDMLAIDEDADLYSLGHDFCVRRVYGKSPVYLNANTIEGYLLYEGQKVIGRCDLFVHGDVAKIEDFCMLQSHQRQGNGTILLNHLIQIALDKGCKTIYLMTDEADSAKKMYLKNGFSKVGDLTEVTFFLK